MGIRAVAGLKRTKKEETEAVRLRARMQAWLSHRERLERSRLLCEHAIDGALARAAAALGDGGSSVAEVVRGRRSGLERQEDVALAVEGAAALLRAAVDIFCRANCPDRWAELQRKRGGGGGVRGWWEGKAESAAVQEMLQRDLGEEHRRLVRLNAAGLAGGAADAIGGAVAQVVTLPCVRRPPAHPAADGASTAGGLSVFAAARRRHSLACRGRGARTAGAGCGGRSGTKRPFAPCGRGRAARGLPRRGIPPQLGARVSRARRGPPSPEGGA